MYSASMDILFLSGGRNYSSCAAVVAIFTLLVVPWAFFYSFRCFTDSHSGNYSISDLANLCFYCLWRGHLHLHNGIIDGHYSVRDILVGKINRQYKTCLWISLSAAFGYTPTISSQTIACYSVYYSPFRQIKVEY